MRREVMQQALEALDFCLVVIRHAIAEHVYKHKDRHPFLLDHLRRIAKKGEDALVALSEAIKQHDEQTLTGVGHVNKSSFSEHEATTRWKFGDELLPFHPKASHVNPDYRDGWNACYKVGIAAALTTQRQPLTTSEIDLIAGKNQNDDGTVSYLLFARAIEAAHGIGDK